jgi:hypothetical protein
VEPKIGAELWAERWDRGRLAQQARGSQGCCWSLAELGVYPPGVGTVVATTGDFLGEVVDGAVLDDAVEGTVLAEVAV